MSVTYFYTSIVAAALALCALCISLARLSKTFQKLSVAAEGDDDKHGGGESEDADNDRPKSVKMTVIP